MGGRAIPLEGRRIFDGVDDLCREHIKVEVQVRSERRKYNEKKSWESKRRFRVVGIRDSDADDGYRLYITNLPVGEFSSEQVVPLYRARRVVELLFRS